MAPGVAVLYRPVLGAVAAEVMCRPASGVVPAVAVATVVVPVATRAVAVAGSRAIEEEVTMVTGAAEAGRAIETGRAEIRDGEHTIGMNSMVIAITATVIVRTIITGIIPTAGDRTGTLMAT